MKHQMVDRLPWNEVKMYLMTKHRPRSLPTAYSIYGAEAFVSTVCMEMILWSLPHLQIAILIFGKSFLISVIVYKPLT